MTKEEIIELAKQAGLFKVSLKVDDKHETLFDMCLLDFAKLIAEKECERIKKQNAPEIEKTNDYIKQLEQGNKHE